MRLIRRDGPMLPGGFPYQDPRTGLKFDGFDSGGFGDQVYRIINHRKINPAHYPANDPEQVLFDFVANQLDRYQCQRLGNDPRHCVDETLPEAKATGVASAGKCKCGGNLVERLCGSCSGRRVVGYVCQVCGAQTSL